MALPERMKFGIFLGPFHRVGENPTLAMDRDMELIQWLDYLGYDEAWIGEHHSAGWEIISSPEIFMAVAADRTRHIKLGTGVVSLPYHHPLMVANRMTQLDHMTHGRVMFGVGPGALPGDAYMMGIDPTTQREKMDEALGIILRLFTETEPITYKERLVRAERGDASDQAVPEAAHANRGRVGTVARRRHARGQVRRVGVDHHSSERPVVRPVQPSRAVGHRRRVGGRARPEGRPL